MKRKIVPYLLTLALLLTGCSNAASTTATTPIETATAATTAQATATPEATPEAIAQDPVIYFCNSQQYNRVYEIGEDGKNLALLVDENAYDVQQTDDAVYYVDRDSRLYRYDLATQQSVNLFGNAYIHTYYVNNDWLFYAVDGTMNGHTDVFYDEWHVLNIATQEDTVITTAYRNLSASYGDCLYFMSWDEAACCDNCSRYDAGTGKLDVILNFPGSFGQIYANRDGLYFSEEQNADEVSLRTWYLVPKDSVEPQKVDMPTLSSAERLFSVDGGNYLYAVYQYSAEDEEYLSWIELHYLKADGEDQLLVSTDPHSNTYCDAQTIPGEEHDLIYLEFRTYKDWEPDSDTFDSGYDAYQDYLFFPATGELKSIDIRGEESLMFENGDFPQLNSGTARKPVTASLYELFVASSGYEGNMPKSDKTHGAWLALADKTADLILVPIPTQEEQDYLDEKGVTIEKKLYGGDGLVFIGNKDNPVESLTHEQILGIYRGEITNWKEVGGPDHEISVYYRNDQSGSQRMFEKLVFENKDVPDFESMEGFGIMDDMSSIVDIIASDPYAVGYSIMTYLHNVYQNDGVKVFSVDGVTPSADTLKDSSYRYGVPEYVVIRADEAQDSPARRLYNWFGSSICDDLLTYAEMTPIHE